MQVILALVVLAVAGGIAVVYWRTSPRHRVAVGADRDRRDRTRPSDDLGR